MISSKPLTGKKLLIVEDEYLLASETTHAMEELGAEVPLMTGSLTEAMDATGSHYDGAVVDINLGGEMAFPLIERLKRMNVPVILVTAYGIDNLPAHLAECAFIRKPFSEIQLSRMAVELFNAS